jgi:hypothetical protein
MVFSLKKTVDFFGFGKTLFNWVTTVYTDQTSCILNNGHCSACFDITRGVHHQPVFRLSCQASTVTKFIKYL